VSPVQVVEGLGLVYVVVVVSLLVSAVVVGVAALAVFWEEAGR
jgi:hypothetical protein